MPAIDLPGFELISWLLNRIPPFSCTFKLDFQPQGVSFRFVFVSTFTRGWIIQGEVSERTISPSAFTLAVVSVTITTGDFFFNVPDIYGGVLSFALLLFYGQSAKQKPKPFLLAQIGISATIFVSSLFFADDEKWWKWRLRPSDWSSLYEIGFLSPAWRRSIDPKSSKMNEGDKTGGRRRRRKPFGYCV